MNMWLVCDMEVAELGSRRLCRMGRGLLKEEGMGLWCARSWGRCGIGHGVLVGQECILHGLELCCWGHK